MESDTGQLLHKETAIARDQKQAADVKPGAGRERYIKGVRWAVIDEDKDGKGFRYDQVYEVLLDGDGRPIDQAKASELSLEGSMRVGYARVLELRKWNGNVQHPRLGIARRDALTGSAVVLPFVRRYRLQPERSRELFGEDSDCEEGEGSRWRVDRRQAAPLLVPLASLGRRVDVEEEDGDYMVSRVHLDAGGPALRSCSYTPETFAGSAMCGPVAKDLMRLKVKELRAELEERGAPKRGRKPELRVRLRALMMSALII